MYEHRRQGLISRAHFLRRVVKHFLAATAIMGASLGLGMAGYAWFEELGWRDAFLNAAMLLGGMGPVHVLATPGGKVFAGLYALYSGLVFLAATGLVLAPVFHRLLHHFHWEDTTADQERERPISRPPRSRS